MDIIITQWALDAYLDLAHKKVFSQNEFNSEIKPDVKLLREYPNPIEFSNGKFWSPAAVTNKTIRHGFKMKWHQVGDGRVQLRLPVAVIEDAFLCEAYVKMNEKVDRRKLAKFKTHLQLIQQGNYKQCGMVK